MRLFQNLGDLFDAIGANYNDVRETEKLGDLRSDYWDTTGKSAGEINALIDEYRETQAERNRQRDIYEEAHNRLVKDDSFFKNIDQMGGTLEGMAAQAAGTIGGAVIGGLAAPFTVGASAVGGAKIGNAVGAVAGGYLDARSVALQAQEDVLDKGGSWEQAKKAYDETLFKASFTTLPETLVDIAMGNRIVSSAAKNIGKSAVGKVGSALLDPASKVGTFVADKTGKSLIGRGAGLLTDIAMQGSTEALQEVTQDYIADREVAKTMGDVDNEYSLGGFKDYMFSPQGLETMKTAGIMGALFGGAGGAISSGQYLKYATNDDAAMARISQLKDYNDKTGKLKIFSDKEAQDNFIQDVANIFNIDKEDIPSFRDALRMYINYDTEYWNVGIADRQVLNTAATNDLIQKLSGDASNRRDITSETTRDFFNFVGEDTAIDVLDKYRADVLERAKTEGQTGTETTTEQGDATGESQPQTKIKATPGLGQQVAGETNPQPYTKTRTETGQAELPTTTQPSNTPATQPTKATFKQSIGKFNKTVEGEGNITYDNGSRSIRLTQMDDGRFNVMDEHNLERGGKVFNTQEEAESFIQKIDEGTATWDDGTRFQGQSKNNAVVEQPNTSDGVISERHESDKASGKKQIIHTADDLRKYFASRKGTPLQMDGRMYFEMLRAIERFGSENLGFNMAEGMGIVDGTAIPGKIDKIRDERGAVTGALITLYRGADAMTALHEIGHFGYWKMSEEEKQQFNEWAIKTESAFLARLLNREYNQQFRNELIVALQTKQGDLWDRIQSEGVMYQTVDMLNNQRSSDLSQIACEERFAWEFSMWYAQGYTKGLQPNNFVQLILDRICGTLENALSLVSDTAEFLKSNGYENIQMGENVKSPLRMFEQMRTNDRPVAQEKQKTETEQPQEQTAEQPTQGSTQEQEETPLEERHVSAIEPDINTTEESRFMYGARGALNSPLNEIVSGKKTTREQQLEKDYTKLFYSLGKSLGYSQAYLDDIFNKYGRISTNKIIDHKNNKKARVFKEINDTVNERIWKGTAKVKGVDFQRGLDGRWRFYFRDNLMHVKQGITKTLVTRPNDLIGRPMKLSDVIKHDILFKYYPTLKDIDVIFNTEKNDPELKDTYAWFDDKLNRIVINYDVLQKEDMKEHVVNGKKYSSMDTNQLERTILHELQHAIQGYEGLAMGGDEGDFTLVSSEYRNFASMLRKKKKEFINYIVKDSGFGFSEKAAESIVNQIFSDKNLRTRMDVLFNLKIQSPGFIEDELLFGFVEKDNLLFDRYYSLLGEIEARDAEKRKNMTEQRWREVAPNNGIGAYTNGLAPITVRDAYVSPAKTEQQRLDEQQAKQQQKEEQKEEKGKKKPSIESVQGLINFAKAMGMSQSEIEQMILNESPNGKEIVEMMRNEQNKQKKKSDTRFMSIGKKAINSPVQNTFKLEMDYLRRYSKLGKQFGYSAFDIHQSYQLFGRDWDSKTVNPQNNQFAEIFIKINDEINNQLWKEGKSVQRGVDGRWRYYINDNNLTVSGDDKFWNGIKNVLQTREFPLASLIKHPQLYNYYPDMKGTSIVFSDFLPNDVEASVMNLTNGKVAIVINYNSLYKNKSVDSKKKWFAKLMLHEMQHVVQDKEGFARGGSTTEFSHIPNATDRYREYAQLLGEIEARDTSQRYGLTEEQWNRTKPLDYDFRYRQAVTRRGKINVKDVGAGNNLRTSNSETRFQSSNRNLNQAKANKNDEFYTRMDDIEKELSNYKDQFKDKVIYCNCDDPQSSNFWKYFVDNFDSLGIKKVISIHYDVNGSYKLEYDGQNTKRTDLQGDGDFRSQESLDTLKDADIVVSNPPFSLFRQYVKQLVDNDKQFLIVGNKNAMTSKEMFPLMKDGNVKLGNNNIHRFNTPDGQVKRFGNIGWFTNLATNKQTKEQEYTQRYYDDNGKPLPNVEQKYPKFDGTDIINVNRVADIPVDYDGVMGVPISFMDNYTESSPFEVVGTVNHGTDGEWDLAKSMVGGKEKFKRIAIKRKGLPKADTRFQRAINKEIENADNILDRKSTGDTRFMGVGRKATGSKLKDQSVIDSLNKEYNDILLKLGIPQNVIDEFIEPKNRTFGTFNQKTLDFIRGHNKANEILWKKGFYRGLDGHWRYWIDDRKSKMNDSIIDKVIKGNKDMSFKLKDVLSHQELFNAYTDIFGKNKGLENLSVEFVTSSVLGGAQAGFNPVHQILYVDRNQIYKDGNVYRVRSRTRQALEEQQLLQSVILHEIQHCIQRYEGFAAGGNNTNSASFKRSGMGNEENVIIQFFNANVEKISKMLAHNQPALVSFLKHCGLKIPKQLSNETNEQYKRRIQQTIEKHLEFMHNNQEIEDALYDYIDNEMSIFNRFFGSAPKTTNGKILQFFIEDPLGKLKSVDWNLPFRIYQSMLGEIEARDTMERFVDEKRNQSVPFNQERVYSGLTNRDVGDFVVVEGMPGVSSDRKMRGRQKFDPLPTKEEREKLKENVKSNKEQKPITDVVKEKMDVANSIIADTIQKIKDGQKIDRGEVYRMFFDDDKEHLNNLIEAILSYYEATKEAPKNLSVRNDIDWLKTAISNNGQLMGDLDYEPLIDRLQAVLDRNQISPAPNANPVVQPQTPQTPSPTQKPTSKPGRQIGGTQKKPTVLTPKNPGKVQQPTKQTPAATPKQPVKTGLTAGEKQKKKEATAEETKKKVIEARKKGEVTDIYKDVYSVSFDKSAQSNEENQRKMRYFEQRLNFWDKTVDKDGKITYTRKVPYQSHQKIINYSGINGIEKLNKPKKKWEEWKDWAKDTLIKYLFNDKHYLAKVARKYDMWDTYVKLVVMKDYSLRANVALTEGIMYNGKRTRALNDIIKEIGEEDQKDFIDYCIAFRIQDLSQHKYWEKKPKLNAKGEYEKDTNGNIVWEEVELTKEILQKMSKKEAKEIIDRVRSSNKADLFEKNRKDFVKYNHALLHVLVDGGIMSEDRFNKFVESDPNFVPLSKVMDDTDFSFNAIVNANSLVNINTPIKKIGTSMREVANPFMEMQKRTAEYYSISARNKAGQIFVNEIAGKIDYLASGDVVQRGQGLLRKVKVDQRDGKLLTKPSDRDQIIYVCNNGEHEFYQIADKEIYLALKSLDVDQMGTIQKMLDKVAHVPSGLVRNTATMVPDFGFRNLFRDNVEAFLTSEHGFIPFVDAIWGMYQMANNTEWYQRYLEQNGEYGTLNRDNGRVDDIARIEDIIEDKINPLRNWNEIRKANMAIMRDTQKAWIDMKNIKSGDFGKAWENTRNGRLFSLMKLAVSPVWAIGKSNKRINDYLEIGTRIGEFKNAKMGYSGLLDRLAKVGVDTNLANAVMNDIYAAGVSKDITLNFGQHGVLGKALNRYIPFFNASLQGIYKLLNTWDLMLTGTTMSGKKNRSLQAELIFKTALISAFAIGIAAAGEGDEDYEEAPDYEKENFWIFPNGIRIPKDQVLGKMIGNSVEKSYSQWKKGKAEPLDILKNIAESFAPDKAMPAIFDMAIGSLGNYDTFYKQAIVPEYMADKLGFLQKDIRTSNFSADVTEALWKTFGINLSAKKLDWAIQKQLTNLGKYLTTVYDAGKQGFNPQDFNERIARGYDKNDSTGAFVGGLKDDVWKPFNLITGTFATNRTQYKSISDFYANYNKYKKLSSDEERMTTEQKKAWKRYQEAYKKDKVFRKELRAIKSNKAFSGKEKRERADKIFKQQIKLAKWAEG